MKLAVFIVRAVQILKAYGFGGAFNIWPSLYKEVKARFLLLST